MDELDFAFIGKRIREIRLENNLTQEYLAHTVGVNVSHISNIETNKVKISLTLLVHICNTLNVTIDYVLEQNYKSPATAIEKELIHTIHSLPVETQEILLKIAKAL